MQNRGKLDASQAQVRGVLDTRLEASSTQDRLKLASK